MPDRVSKYGLRDWSPTKHDSIFLAHRVPPKLKDDFDEACHEGGWKRTQVIQGLMIQFIESSTVTRMKLVKLTTR